MAWDAPGVDFTSYTFVHLKCVLVIGRICAVWSRALRSSTVGHIPNVADIPVFIPFMNWGVK